MQVVTDNLPLILGGMALILFVIGLVLALRTPGGRNALATAAVRLAVAFLALAERWLGGVIMPPEQRNAVKGSPREDLTLWLDR